MKCIIKERRVKVPTVTDEDRRIARLKGEPPPKAAKAVGYRNLENGEEFLCLSGGFAWPSIKPGFSIVLGVQKNQGNERPIFKVIEEVEEKDVGYLIKCSFDLYQKYGINCRVIPWQWYGDQENGLNKFLYDFNEKLKKTKEEQSFYLTYPPHFKEPNAFEIYCQIIHSFLQPDHKRLLLEPPKIIQSYIGQLGDAGHKDNPEEHPAICALGYAISALSTYEPWLRDSDILEEEEDYEKYVLREHERVLRDLEGNDIWENIDFGIED